MLIFFFFKILLFIYRRGFGESISFFISVKVCRFIFERNLYYPFLSTISDSIWCNIQTRKSLVDIELDRQAALKLLEANRDNIWCYNKETKIINSNTFFGYSLLWGTEPIDRSSGFGESRFPELDFGSCYFFFIFKNIFFSTKKNQNRDFGCRLALKMVQIQLYFRDNTSVLVNLCSVYTLTYTKARRLQEKHALICDEPATVTGSSQIRACFFCSLLALLQIRIKCILIYLLYPYLPFYLPFIIKIEGR